LQVIRIYVQSGPRIQRQPHGATPLADNGINKGLIKRHSFID